MKKFFIPLSILLAAGRLMADPLSVQQLADSIKADHAYVLSHPQPDNAEALRLAHDAQMVKDMDRRDAEVVADHAAYNKYLADWVQKMKDAAAAERLAEAAARQAEIEARHKALQDALMVSEIRANNAYTSYMVGQ